MNTCKCGNTTCNFIIDPMMIFACCQCFLIMTGDLNHEFCEPCTIIKQIASMKVQNLPIPNIFEKSQIYNNHHLDMIIVKVINVAFRYKLIWIKLLFNSKIYFNMSVTQRPVYIELFDINPFLAS